MASTLRAIARVAGGALMIGLVHLPWPAEAQQSSRPPAARTETVTTAVLVDVVVRDRRGRPVTDLSADDFELREDGDLQTVGSFTRVSRGGGVEIGVGMIEPGATLVQPGAGTSGTAGVPDGPPAEPGVTALVFDALSATALALCQRAALGYLPRSTSEDLRVGVFTADPVVRMLQGYTEHPAVARHAVNALQPTGSTVKEQQAEQIAQVRQRRDALEVQASAAAAATAAQLGTASGNIGQVELERRLVRGQLRMMNAFEALDRDHRGLQTTGALFGVLQTLVEMPGRKTLVFFSEGLPASPALQVHLQSIIETANRLNVTVYAVDASGLRALASTADTRREVEEAGAARLQQLSLLRDDAEEPLTRSLERAEDLLRLDSQSGLARLARGTGGFLIRDTNDLGDAVRRIDEDQRFHYLLTYAPSNQVLDGTFRRISVQVRRPGTRVFARDGYRALRTPPSIPVRPSEVPVLAALDAGTLPTDLSFGTTALAFPQHDGLPRVALLVRLPTEQLTFEEQPDRDLYRGDATVVIRVKDADGEVAEQLSQQYQFSGKLKEIDRARRGEVLFYRLPRIAPGVYTIEAAVLDGASGRMGARVSTLTVRGEADGLALVSDLVLVRRTERVADADRDAANPLQADDLLLYPSTGETWSRRTDREVSFYMAIQPLSTQHLAEARLVLRRNGLVLGEGPTQLGVPDAHGWIRHRGRLPLEPLTPGVYQLAVIVGDEERAAFFTVVE